MKRYTREELFEIVQRIDDLVFGDQVDPPRYKLRWEPHPVFPVAVFQPDREALLSWMNKDLRELDKDDEQRSVYLDMIENPIRSPVVLLPVGGSLHILDGAHRLAASMISERKTIPAFILRLEPVVAHDEVQPDMETLPDHEPENGHEVQLTADNDPDFDPDQEASFHDDGEPNQTPNLGF
jgi:hypothetical protein